MPFDVGDTDGWLRVEHLYPRNGHHTEPRYRLEGGPIVRISMEALGHQEPPQVFEVGVYRFYRLGYDGPHMAIVAAHINGSLWWRAVLRYYRTLIRNRFLVTCVVWGLAEYRMGRQTTWGDVYAVRWVQRRIRRWHA